MKKLVVLALSALLVLSFATMSMAAATFSGEIRVGISGSTAPIVGPPAQDNVAATSDFAYGKMVLNGKLGEDLTGTLVFLSDPVTAISVDEANVTFTEDWGSVKLGFYGWNNNIKDIIGTVTPDIKSKTVASFSFPITDALKLGVAYAYTGNVASDLATKWFDTENAFGLDLGFAGETFGLDALYFYYSGQANAWGANAYLKLGDVKPFVQYRNLTWYGESVSDAIIGITYEPASAPIYLRAEVNVANEGIYTYVKDTSFYQDSYNYAPWGFRFGYKLEDGAVIEAQYKTSGWSDVSPDQKNSEYYVKLKCPF